MPFCRAIDLAALFFIAVLFLLFGAVRLHATPSSGNVCDQAAVIASHETSVPLSVLLAVTRTETGRSLGAGLEPWPWSINVGGQGAWLSSRSEAERVAKEKVSDGIRNIDIGCFQLNYRWHGDAFSSISDMFDPFTNAKYAAEFLSQLFLEEGDWTDAVGAFHSRTTEISERYKSKYSAIYANLQNELPSFVQKGARIQEANQFPLLQQSSVRPVRGSLVPLNDNLNRRSLVSRSGN
ncbi:MAG: hypothetical protein R8G34_11690 [Paracoccaceae bacterium]|nr:hypothetical protein [Paracoccaceae bacterium]